MAASYSLAATAPRPSHENASTAIGVVPLAAISSSTSFSAFLKSGTAIASRTFCTIVGGGGAGFAVSCAKTGATTIRDKNRADVVRVMIARIPQSRQRRRRVGHLEGL